MRKRNGAYGAQRGESLGSVWSGTAVLWYFGSG